MKVDEYNDKFMVYVPRILTEEEAAKQMKVSLRTLVNLREDGVGPLYIPVDGSIFYDARDIACYMCSIKIDPADDLDCIFHDDDDDEEEEEEKQCKCMIH